MHRPVDALAINSIRKIGDERVVELHNVSLGHVEILVMRRDFGIGSEDFQQFINAMHASLYDGMRVDRIAVIGV
jgi:hypothetical protein